MGWQLGIRRGGRPGRVPNEKEAPNPTSKSFGYQGMIASGPALEYRFQFEGPQGLGTNLPIGMGCHQGIGFEVVGLVVRAKVEASPLPCSLGRRVQEGRLHQAILPVASLWPGIWKKDVNLSRDRAGWQGREKIRGIGANKVKIRELGALSLAICSSDPLQDDIDPDAEPVGMLLGVTG